MNSNFKKYLAIGVLCGLLSWGGYAGMGSAGFLFMTLLWGVAFFTPLLIDLVPSLFRQSRNQALRELQGVYYAFDRTRIRVFYSENKVWLASEDVYAALNIRLGSNGAMQLLDGERHRMIPGTRIVGIPETQMRNFLRYLKAPEKERFLQWFERGVVKPIRTKIERGIHVPEQVG